MVNAFYATQQLFVKAYGNYLGIAQLGAFMAHEMRLKMSRMNVIVGVAKSERISKTDQPGPAGGGRQGLLGLRGFGGER